MKRLISFLLTTLLMVYPSVAFATGTVTGTCANIGTGELRTVTLSWTADSSAATIPDTSSSSITCPGGKTATAFVQGYMLCGGQTSTTAGHRPTDNYDIYVYDVLSNDLMGDGLTNRDQNATEYGVPAMLSGSTKALGCRFVTGSWNVSISGNSENSASGAVTLFFVKP